jgi:hypothetical protein
MAGLVPVLSYWGALYPSNRDHRGKPSDDKSKVRRLSRTIIALTRQSMRPMRKHSGT